MSYSRKEAASMLGVQENELFLIGLKVLNEVTELEWREEVLFNTKPRTRHNGFVMEEEKRTDKWFGTWKDRPSGMSAWIASVVPWTDDQREEIESQLNHITATLRKLEIEAEADLLRFRVIIRNPLTVDWDKVNHEYRGMLTAKDLGVI